MYTISTNNYFSYYGVGKYGSHKEGRRNMSSCVAERHNLDEVVGIVLNFCYHDVYEKHGNLIPTIYDGIKVSKDEMGIMFTEDISKDYLDVISSLFEDYNFHPFDYPYFKNIGTIDIKKTMKRYSKLEIDTIRNVTMYAMNAKTRNFLLKNLNGKSLDYQEKVCKLIFPISMELVPDDNLINDKFMEFKYYLADSKFKFNEKFLTTLADSLQSDSYSEETEKLKSKNLYFMWVFEYLFQTLYFLNIDKINEENIDILLKMREYAIDNIPVTDGEIVKVPQYKTRSYEVMSSGANPENAVYSTYTKYESEYIGDKKYDYINFFKEEVLNQKELLIRLVPMLLENNVDYKELMKCNCGSYVANLIDYVEKKDEKVKKICK